MVFVRFLPRLKIKRICTTGMIFLLVVVAFKVTVNNVNAFVINRTNLYTVMSFIPDASQIICMFILMYVSYSNRTYIHSLSLYL